MFLFIKKLVKEYGLWWVIQRAFYEVTVISGWKKYSFRSRSWRSDGRVNYLKSGAPCDETALFQHWLDAGNKYFFDIADLISHRDSFLGLIGEQGFMKLKLEADAILAGKFTYFYAVQYDVSFPPRWNYNPMTGSSVPGDLHWSLIKMHDDNYGDLKFVWEPSRFASAYVLSRAWFATADERYAEGFWTLVEDWYKNNTPNTGPNWKCGQEAGIRVIAWCFALHILKHSKATTPRRFAILLTMIAAHAERIKADHLYAHLQKNNHSMSEGAALLTIGLLFPQFKKADNWAKSGKRYLEKEALALIRPDGTFIQKSHNYHRLMLQLYSYCIQLANVHGAPISKKVQNLINKAADYLCQVVDDSNGSAPNFGANDGALIMPFTTCDYQDFRPVAETAHYLFSKELLYKQGPWHEGLFWLFGRDALGKPGKKRSKDDFKAQYGGIFILRGSNSYLFTHCENFTSRPSHADSLHVDVWWKGINIACDAGTYLYYGNKPWNDSFKGTISHNTVAVDGMDQMDRGPRFLWTNWHKARVDNFLTDSHEGIKYFEGEHGGYWRLPDPVSHRRAIALNKVSDMIIVIDDLVGKGRHRCTLQWLFDDFPFTYDEPTGMLSLSTPGGKFVAHVYCLFPQEKATHHLYRGMENIASLGWISRSYGVKIPGISFLSESIGALPFRFMTVLSPLKDIHARIRGNNICINDDTTLILSNIGAWPVVQKMYSGSSNHSNPFSIVDGAL